MTVAAVLLSFVAKPGFYPGRKVGRDYAEAHEPVLETRLRLGGVNATSLA